MRTLFLKIIFSLLCLGTIFAQERKLSENAFISVLTCDTGNELYSLFGHTGIRVSDRINGIDIVYNYGTFDFSTPNFYLKFSRGNLQYMATATTFDDFMSEYIHFHRGVYEQRLNIEPQQKQQIFDELNRVLQSESRFYTYKFIDRNCTTMVAEVLEQKLPVKFSLQVKDASKTNRTILYDYLKDHFYENLGINILFGMNTDKNFDKIFLPLQLMESISVTKINGQPLSNATETLNPKNNIKEQSVWNNYYTFTGFFILLLLLAKKEKVRIAYFSLFGLLGLFIIILATISYHKELEFNYNLLLFNPFLLLLIWFIFKNAYQYIIVMSSICLISVTIYIIIMINKIQFVMFLPIIIVQIVFLYFTIKHTKTRHHIN
ncbi:MAG TPA: DUF4105 domain-containing protein [Flavobacterium sp.]|jgi:hypothetical protein